MGQKMFDSPILLWSSQFCRACLKGVFLEHPAVKRNRDAELVFFVALSLQGAKVRVWLVAKSSNGPVAVSSGGA
jgi:hypothetical protein